MKAWLETQAAYIALVAVWLVIGGVIVILTQQNDLHLMLNTYNAHGFDRVVLLVNLLSDQRITWVFGAILCVWRIRWGVAVLVSVIGAAVASTVLKRGVFGPVPRPVPHFGEPSPLYLVPDVEVLVEYSMPSGHAAVGFALFTALALLTRRGSLQAACFAGAFLVAYSRVYLSQHFFEDIYAGSLVGMVAAFAAHAAVRPLRVRDCRRRSAAPAHSCPH